MKHTLIVIAALSAAAPVHARCMFLDDEQTAMLASSAMLARIAEDCAADGLDFAAELSSGKVPFHMIVATGASPEAVRIALEAGTDPNTTNQWGDPAFVDLINFSMEKDDPVLIETLRLLGEAGADFSLPDSHGDLALSKAAGGREIETVRVLLEYGADPNGLDTYNRTPLFQTVFKHCDPEMGALLIERGARIDPMPEDQIRRMFDEAAPACAGAPGGADYLTRLKALPNG